MLNHNRPLVTIGIPTYSRLEYLKQAVASALAQTYRPLEVVISQNPHGDPATTDRIQRYCERLRGVHPEIRYQLNATNVGPPANFNRLADAADGEYLAMIGDDDRLLPHSIEQMVSVLEPNTSLVFGHRVTIDSNGSKWERQTRQMTIDYGRDLIVPGPVANPEISAWQQATQTECSLIRTADFRRIRFREDIDMADVAFFILLARQVGNFVFLPEVVSEYRLHSDSTTGRGFRNYFELINILQALPVAADVAQYKQKLLEQLTASAVTRCLSEGSIERARTLVESPYYRGAASKRRIVQLISALPRDAAAIACKGLCALRYRTAFEIPRN